MNRYCRRGRPNPTTRGRIRQCSRSKRSSSSDVPSGSVVWGVFERPSEHRTPVAPFERPGHPSRNSIVGIRIVKTGALTRNRHERSHVLDNGTERVRVLAQLPDLDSALELIVGPVVAKLPGIGVTDDVLDDVDHQPGSGRVALSCVQLRPKIEVLGGFCHRLLNQQQPKQDQRKVDSSHCRFSLLFAKAVSQKPRGSVRSKARAVQECPAGGRGCDPTRANRGAFGKLSKWRCERVKPPSAARKNNDGPRGTGTHAAPRKWGCSCKRYGADTMARLP